MASLGQGVHKGDLGTTFIVTITEDGAAKDISAASVTKILFERPDQTYIRATANFTTDGTDGKIEYTTIAGDISLAGRWVLQAYIELGGGKWWSDAQEFEIFDSIPLSD